VLSNVENLQPDARYVSTNDVEIGMVGMTDSGLSGVSYVANPPRTNLVENNNASTEITLTIQDGTKPGTFSIMTRASALEKNNLVISLLYPVLVTLDVPEPLSNESIILKPQTTAVKQNQSSDATIYMALFTAGVLIAFMIYRRVRNQKLNQNKK
jgi:hypothetical protein